MSSDSEIGTLHQLTSGAGMQVPEGLLRVLGSGDALLLMQDAVWLACSEDALRCVSETVRLFVLQDDLAVRGLSQRRLHPRLSVVDDAEWVQLSEHYPRSLTWSG